MLIASVLDTCCAIKIIYITKISKYMKKKKITRDICEQLTFT